ncbi:MAG: ammonium transporter [Clostridia bacterium]|nr:ammonium transporter [Clostridia bacterium]
MLDNVTLAQGINTVWVLLCAALVFFMEAGFAMLEAGFIRAKNSLNIIMKVFIDCCSGLLGYWILGFGVMYGLDKFGIIGTTGFFMSGDMSNLPFLKQFGLSVEVYWMFQAAFAVAVATIVSGAVAERMKFLPYMVFSFLATAVIYPVAGHMVWNPDGLFAKMGMLDFAGSAAVHSVGGWASLAAVLVLGPRIGKYKKDGSANVIQGHSIPLAALGAFILWFGWFGFNPGSALNAFGEGASISHVVVATNLAAAAGGLISALFTQVRYGKVDASMTINGALAGLVAITAGCAYVNLYSAAIIGAVAGVLVVMAIELIDKKHADDPVGAIAVHGVCGSFGVIAVGLFASQSVNPAIKESGLFFGGGFHLLGVQAAGLVVVSLWAFAATFGLFKLLKAISGIRVSAEDETEGMDISEHGLRAYAQTAIDDSIVLEDINEDIFEGGSRSQMGMKLEETV